MSLYICVPVANPAGRAEVVGHTGPAEMGVQPPHEHSGPVRASTGSLGGGENGSLPPHLRAGNTSLFSAKHYLQILQWEISKTLLPFHLL